MEILGLGNNPIADVSMAQNRHEAEIGRFQAALNTAMARQNDPNEGSVLDRAALRNAAEMMESYFINMMFREMRRTTLNEHSFIPKSHAERIFQEMLDEQVAEDAARAGGIGLADMIYRQMTQHLN